MSFIFKMNSNFEEETRAVAKLSDYNSFNEHILVAFVKVKGRKTKPGLRICKPP